MMRLQLESDIACETATPEKLTAFLQRNILKIAQPLAGELQWYSPHARLVTESMKIVSVEKLTRDRFKMVYQFDGNIFSPCLDLNETFTRQEQVTLQVVPGFIEFELIDNQQPSPADEL